jgi:hypothetical protein
VLSDSRHDQSLGTVQADVVAATQSPSDCRHHRRPARTPGATAKATVILATSPRKQRRVAMS